jgi:hypothetical protein
VELWLEPSWSSTQWAYEDSTHLLRLFRVGPTAPECCALDTACTTDAGKACMSLVYTLEPDNGGRTGRHNLSYLRLLTWGVEPFTAYPARLFLTPERWYHLAAWWRIDGNATVVNLFVDGRRKAYYQLGAASECDVAEQCTGSSASCPPDVFATSGVCRPSAGAWRLGRTTRCRRPHLEHYEIELPARLLRPRRDWASLPSSACPAPVKSTTSPGRT